ncbi:MAG: hypothetical protein AAF754_18890 [Pseudomonadota bacterium]
MPPIRRFWPYYLGLAAIVLGLIWVGQLVFIAEPKPQQTAYVLAAGVVVALISIVATSVSSWRSMRVQQTFTALQTLRTDREYLINALRVEAEPGLVFGVPLNSALQTKFRDEKPSKNVDNPSFGQAARFLLNQYEFIAAAARLGQLDEEMLRNTIKSGFGSLVKTFAPVIAVRREGHPDSMANIVWLYRRLYQDHALDLGPPPEFQNPMHQNLGKVLGVVPLDKQP